MKRIRRSGFKWDGFVDGFSQRFAQEIRDNNINSEQLYWLGGMENIIYNHLTTKPKSDRRTAILCLAWVTMARSEDLLKESPNIMDSVDWH